MKDAANWVGLDTHFDYERSLQGYIAAYPHFLEDGLLPHPDIKIREKVFPDGTRSDVLLIDRDHCPVVVECKQGTPIQEDISQLRHYMKLIAEETEKDPRGILIHGGALKLSDSIRKVAAKKPAVEIVRYSLKVDFDRSA
jgi:RecB family endonuclease NucS